MMKKMMDSKNDGHQDMSYSHNQNNHGYKSSDYNNYMKTQSRENTDMSQLWDTMSKFRFKRQTDDSLALNDRLTDKLKTMMEEHVHKVSNMTCVLRELNVIDYNNNIDVNAIKEDSKQYKMPSQWFQDKYEGILDSCHQVAENLPARLQEEYVPKNYNGPLKNLLEGFNNQLTEEQVFFMVNELLQGSED